MNESKAFRRPRRVAMLGSLPPIRGLSSYCLELALAISNLGKVEFISFRKIYPSILYPGGDLNIDKTFPAIKHANLKVKRRITWYNPMTWIREGIFTGGELLHAQWWSWPLLPIYLFVLIGFKIRGKPIVITVHNVLSHEKYSLFKVISKLLFKLGDHFIVHSLPNKNQLIEYYNIPSNRVTQIPHGPLDLHIRQGNDRNETRRKLGIQEKDKVILLFGAIRSYKGVDTALQAFVRVLQEKPEARLLIVGKLWVDWSPYEKLMIQLGIENRVSCFHKYIPSKDVGKFFIASDLVILPYHRFDSQSGVGATAISFRKPMIVTNVGGLPEFVSDEKNIVSPQDPKALARVIIDCLKNPDRLYQMAKDAGKVAERIAWPSIAGKTWEVYRRVLNLDIVPEVQTI